MGWFSADAVIAPTISNAPEKSDTVQTVALCILAAVAACWSKSIVEAPQASHRAVG